jgi:hypothetical protein
VALNATKDPSRLPTWIEANGFQDYVDDDQMQFIYMISLYVSIVAMFGGIGTVGPNNPNEYLTLIFILGIGCFFWAYVISSLCTVLGSLSPHKTEFRNTMDALNHFMDDNNFVTDHRVRIRRFFRSTQDYTRQEKNKRLIDLMSPRLKGDTALLIGVATLRKVWYFDVKAFKIEKDFLAAIALKLSRRVWESKERFHLDNLTVMLSGTACIGLRIVLKGAVMGLDALIKDEHKGLRDNDNQVAACLTFAETAWIDRDTVFKVARRYPKALAHLGWVTRRLTLRAAVKKVIKKLADEKLALRNQTYDPKKWGELIKDEDALEDSSSIRRAINGALEPIKVKLPPIDLDPLKLFKKSQSFPDEQEDRDNQVAAYRSGKLKRTATLGALQVNAAMDFAEDSDLYARPLTVPVRKVGPSPWLTAKGDRSSRSESAAIFSEALPMALTDSEVSGARFLAQLHNRRFDPFPAPFRPRAAGHLEGYRSGFRHRRGVAYWRSFRARGQQGRDN